MGRLAAHMRLLYATSLHSRVGGLLHLRAVFAVQRLCCRSTTPHSEVGFEAKEGAWQAFLHFYVLFVDPVKALDSNPRDVLFESSQVKF